MNEEYDIIKDAERIAQRATWAIRGAARYYIDYNAMRQARIDRQIAREKLIRHFIDEMKGKENNERE